jgi:hypothetical protein
MNDFSKTLIFFGVILIGIGLFTAVAGKIPGLGKLPGDIYFRKGALTFYFPLATCLVLSLVLTLIFNLFGKK